MHSNRSFIYALAASFAIGVPVLAGHVKMDFQKRAASLKRRDSFEVAVTESQNRSLYAIHLEIGTPPQPFELQLDTGSSDLWVPSVAASSCQMTSDGCPGGAFNPNASSTCIISDEDFTTSYGDGTKDSGYYFTDVVHLGTASIQNFTMGLTTTTANGPQVNNTGQGILGISYRQDEAATEFGLQTTPTIYEEMVDQGLIDRSAFSLYLNDAEIGQGSILFGGVDPSKYTGDLVALPLQFLNGTLPAYWVALTNISFTDDEGTHALTGGDFQGGAALLDSGTTQSRLPNDVFNNLIQGLGAVIGDVTGGSAVVPCSLRDDNKTSISFQFGGTDGPSMEVPLSAMIDSEVLGSSGGIDFCLLSAGPSLKGDIILGDSFLRSFYVVYDVANNQVALATAALNATGTSSIVDIPTGTSIPGATSTAAFMLPTTTANATATVAPITAYSGVGSATFSLGALSTSGGSLSTSGGLSASATATPSSNTASASTTATPSSNAASAPASKSYGILWLSSLLFSFMGAYVSSAF